MNRLYPISFVNQENIRLAGVVEEPVDGPTRAQAVVLLSPGVKTRIAPHRLYGKLASRLTEHGFRVLRFDFYGLGDSQGTVTAATKRELYASIQVGRYVGDTKAALDWMQRTYGTSSFIVGGLCGGAVTGVLAAPNDARIVGILGLGLPVTLDAPGADSTRFMSVGQLRSVRSRYLRKVLDPRAWLRIVSLQTDFRLLIKALTISETRPRSETPGDAAPPTDNTNPLLLPHFLQVLERGCKVQLVFGEVDRLCSDFDEKFRQRYEARWASSASNLEVHVIRSANHVLTLSEWQREWFDTAIAWCQRQFPPTSTVDLASAS